MSVFAISDLHLAISVKKPMDVFGGRWQEYMTRLEENWNAVVSGDDYVLIPGDISWATYLNEISEDFAFIERLPGKKVISKGNHDYWWTTLKKLNAFIKEQGFETMRFLNNDCCNADGMAVCGTRGWKCPGDDDFSEEDLKLYDRELIRLKLSLECARKLGKPMTAMLHYPPFSRNLGSSGFTELLCKYEVKKCIYGHLHGEYSRNAFTGMRDGTEYLFVAADHLQFKPLKISEQD